MYVWIGALLPKEYEAKIRDKCNVYNLNIGLDNVAFSLPQHISLKISFECEKYLKAIELVENILKRIEPTEVEIVGINKIKSIIWLEIKENEVFQKLHNSLDETLLENLNIYQKEFDKDFKFHSTVYFDRNEDKLLDMFNLLRKEEFNDKVIINSYAIGISESGKPGTFKIEKYINSKL